MLDLEEKPKTKKLPEFVPVIFANGIDDDTPGFVALFTHEKVQYGEKIYKPNESIHITNATMVITRSMVITGDGKIEIFVNQYEEPLMLVCPNLGRKIEISDSTILWKGAKSTL